MAQAAGHSPKLTPNSWKIIHENLQFSWDKEKKWSFSKRGKKSASRWSKEVNGNHPDNQMMCWILPSSRLSLTSNPHTAHSHIRKTANFKNANFLNVSCRLASAASMALHISPPPSYTFISPLGPVKITHSLVLYAKILPLLREILFVRRLSC